MENYKKSFYSKKFSNDLNFAGIQGKRAYWSLILSSISWNYYDHRGIFFFLNISIFSCIEVTIKSSPSSS